jgi:hypothetical protein
MVSREQNFLSVPTDTATPITPVPIFYVHEGEHPFCLLPECICHAHEAQLRSLLLGVITGATKMRKVYNGVIVGKEVS